jgi:catechol 2,3-dioxygenase-like lactoylglutathione lyase family enzyme
MPGLLPVTSAYSHTIVAVSNMARSLEWYQKVFGFEILNRTTVDARSLDEMLGLANASLEMVRGYVGCELIELVELKVNEGQSSEGPSTVVKGVTVSVSDVALCYELAQKGGVDIMSPPVSFGDYNSMLIRDPDGTMFDLTDYQGLNPHSYLGRNED